MENVGGYALRTTTTLSFEDAIAKTTELLAANGFGILTEIDVQATLKKKLNLDTKPYKILGACNPPFAHRALEAENLIGVLLPCNVVVWDEGDHRVVSAINPMIMAEVVDSDEIRSLAGEVSNLLTPVLEAIEKL
ncbi:DUF302 domain-containing protein [bacterium]|nr:DUF302 domain-containing protein [bacterium]